MTDINTGMDSTYSAQGAQGTNLKDKAMDSARKLVHQAETQANERITEGKHQAAATLTSLANTLRNSGQQLRSEEELVAGDYVERAANQIERAARFIENAELRDLVRNVEGFARRNPGVFIGAAFAIGIAGARFLKSTRDDGTHAEPFADREVQTPRVSEGFTGAQRPSAWGSEYGG